MLYPVELRALLLSFLPGLPGDATGPGRRLRAADPLLREHVRAIQEPERGGRIMHARFREKPRKPITAHCRADTGQLPQDLPRLSTPAGCAEDLTARVQADARAPSALPGRSGAGFSNSIDSFRPSLSAGHSAIAGSGRRRNAGHAKTAPESGVMTPAGTNCCRTEEHRPTAYLIYSRSAAKPGPTVRTGVLRMAARD